MNVNINNHTYVALISREVPSNLAKNLVIMGENLTTLVAKSDAELESLGLSQRSISAIKDSKRPSIPDKTLRKVLSDSWRTCCICRTTGEPIVVHHIEEWAVAKSHDEKNLVVLCLNHHDEAHLKYGLSQKLPASDIRELKKQWITLAASVKHSYEKRLAETKHRSARWYWIHYNNLIQETTQIKPPLHTNINPDNISLLCKGKFIGTTGTLNPQTEWVEKLEKEKAFLFDSGMAQLMAIYVSDIMGKFVVQSSCLDISSFLDKPSIIKKYVKENGLVFFRCPLEVDKPNGEELILRVINRDVRIEIKLNLWGSLNASSKGTHLLKNLAERSVVGTIQSLVEDGPILKITVSPLGVSADFVLDGPAQGDWVELANNKPQEARLSSAKE